TAPLTVSVHTNEAAPAMAALTATFTVTGDVTKNPFKPFGVTGVVESVITGGVLSNRTVNVLGGVDTLPARSVTVREAPKAPSVETTMSAGHVPTTPELTAGFSVPGGSTQVEWIVTFWFVHAPDT